ncbi:MAG: diaminopimelate epimerase, partial [Mycobacterium sp.]|nr:diaminopimelate epimerase [Mycobacterium sp.]
LRAVRASNVDDRPSTVDSDLWFMDYRNADGSIAEMCGNGIRVFARYLVDAGLVEPGEFGVGTRNGTRTVTVHADGSVTVDMGPARISGESTATVAGRAFRGVAVDVGNPHLACVDPALTVETLAALDVAAPVTFDEAQFPDGVNVEVLTAPADGAVSMRVHERGVGETRSCGTGTVAAAVAALGGTGTLTVRVPGGDVVVTITEATSCLRGPSVLVARGELSGEWWQRAQR